MTDDPPFEPTASPVVTAADDAESKRCPSCLGTVENDQQYCLTCGQRVGDSPIGSGRRIGGVSPLLVGITGAVVLVLGLLIAWGITGGPDNAGVVRSHTTVPGPSSGASTLRTIGSTTDGVDTSTDTTDTATDTTDPSTDTTDTSTDTTATPPDAAADDWPDGTSSWAVILYSKPSAEFGWDHFVTKKDEAVASGISDAGLLLSDNYVSLVPGIYVLYRGPLGSRHEAIAAAKAAHGDYPGAYARWVSETESTPP